MAKTVLPDGRVVDEPPQFAGPAVPAFPGMGDMVATFDNGGGAAQQYPPMPEMLAGPSAYLPEWSPQYNDTMFGELFAQNPFPPELVPPFRVEGGLTDDPDALFGMFLNNEGFRPASFMGANVDLGQYGATTRQVQPEELLSEQLTSLLNSDSGYMQNALQRGREVAQDRGALSSSIFAGASQRSAIEAGVPIASANAQAYIQAASENMAALNQNTLAKMQAAVNLAISNSQTAAQVSIANTNASVSRENALIGLQGARLAADSRERVAEAELNAQFTMQQTQFLQDQLIQMRELETQTDTANLQAGTSMFLGGLQAQTTIDVSRLDADTRLRLQEMGIEGNIKIQELTHAQRIDIEEMFTEPRFRAEYMLGVAQMRASLETRTLETWANMVQSMNGLELDDAARARGMQFANDLVRDMNKVTEWFSDPANWNFDFSALTGGGG